MNLARIKSFRELPPFRTDLTSFLLFPRLPLRTRRRRRRSLLLPHPFILRRKSAVLLDFALTRQRQQNRADMNFVTYSGILLGKRVKASRVAIGQREEIIL